MDIKIQEGKHTFYPPIILKKVNKGMPAFDKELLGSGAEIISAEIEEKAIKLANCIWTWSRCVHERYSERRRNSYKVSRGCMLLWQCFC